jgi:alcohol dehydrogenase
MDWTNSFEYRSPARIVFGPDSTRRTGPIARDLGCTSALIVTDPGLHRLGLTNGVEKSLKEAGLGVAVFSGVTTEPTLDSVDAGVQAYRDVGADLIVGVGGGSSLDTSKAISLLLGNGGKYTDFIEKRVGAEWIRGRRIERRGSTLITIPTTSGTGSEVTAGCGVFDPTTGKKGWVGDLKLMTSVAICDPVLTASMPPRITADTGMDALSQAMESYLNGTFSPYADAWNLTGIEIIGKWLPKAFANGRDLAARSAMLAAATMVGVSFPNGGLIHVHSFAEILGDVTHLPHGRLIGLSLPAILEWSLIACPEKMAVVAEKLGEKVDGLSTRDAAERGLAAVRRLCHDVEIDEGLKAHGVTEAQLRDTAEGIFAMHESRSLQGPRGFRSVDEVMSVLRKAY